MKIEDYIIVKNTIPKNPIIKPINLLLSKASLVLKK